MKIIGRRANPLLDRHEWTIIKSLDPGARVYRGKFSMTFDVDICIPLLKDIKAQAPNAQCDLVTTNVSTNLIVNQFKPPFDNPDIRKAMVLAVDRKAFVDILSEGQNVISGAAAPPDGVWEHASGVPEDGGRLRSRRRGFAVPKPVRSWKGSAADRTIV